MYGMICFVLVVLECCLNVSGIIGVFDLVLFLLRMVICSLICVIFFLGFGRKVIVDDGMFILSFVVMWCRFECFGCLR